MKPETRSRASASDDPRRNPCFLVPLVAGAAMLLAATAFAAGGDTPVQGPGADASVATEAPEQDCAAAGETVDGMPSTEHQRQVLKEVDEADADQLQAMAPAAGCPDAGDLPATRHQEELLDGGAAQ